MNDKNEKQIKIYNSLGYNKPSVPRIQLQGKWLEQLGFHIGDTVNVTYQDNQIILQTITPESN